MCSLPHLTFNDSVEARKRVSSILTKYAGAAHEGDDLIDILDLEAEKFLSASSSAIYRKIALEDIHEAEFRNSSNAVLSEFANWMHWLKNEIAALRTSRKQKLKQPEQRKRALPIEYGTPLQEEVQLLRLQWNKADELAVGHNSDLGELVTYKLKLMILLRWWSFNKKRGFETFQEITKPNT
jgi:hypothetical protein